MLRHARMCRVPEYANMCQEFQGNKTNNQAKMKGNEHIIGLISRDFIFFKRGMLGTLIICSNTFQVPMRAKC